MLLTTVLRSTFQTHAVLDRFTTNVDDGEDNREMITCTLSVSRRYFRSIYPKCVFVLLAVSHLT